MTTGGYTKLFSSILASTIWGEPDHVRILWITMLALADRFGNVEAALPGLAHAARLTIEQTQAGLKRLQQPDAHSRTPDHEGRRIAPTPGGGGWSILNHGKYRALMNADDRREYNRLKQQQHREKVKNTQPSPADLPLSTPVNNRKQKSAMSAHSRSRSRSRSNVRT